MSGGPPQSKRAPLSQTQVDDFRSTFVTDGHPGEGAAKLGIFLVTAGEDVGRVIAVPPGAVVSFGRSEECTARFEDESLSRVHSRCIRFGEAYVFDDAKSTNGTFVNGVRITATVQLSDGDAVALGNATRMRFSLVDEAEERGLREMYETRKNRGRVSLPAQLEEDLEQARDFQQRMLAAAPKIPGVEIDVLYQPVELVGGDLYQLHLLETGALRVFVADAVGHGVQASLTTMLIVSEYERVRHRPSPAAALAGLNDAIATKYPHARVQFTGICIDFDFARGLLSHGSAGHPSACRIRDGVVEELDGGGGLMGLVPGVVYPEYETTLIEGDRLLAFTDGATEQFNAAGTAFGDVAFVAAIIDAAAARQPIATAVAKALTTFSSGVSLADDVTLLSVWWSGDEARAAVESVWTEEPPTRT